MPGSLRDIRLFVAAFEERSFTAAGLRENATQSGVSQHIRKLEESLGVKLFTRDKGQVSPTPAGTGYYQRCIDILRAHEAATRTARTYAHGLEGEIHVGLMPTMTRCVLAPSLARFVEDHPNVVVRILEGYSGTLTQKVRAGELDFAIVPAFPGLAGLKSRLFQRTPEVLVSGEDFAARNKLVHLQPVTPGSLSRLKLVLPSAINTRRRTLETYCASNGIEIERLIELDAMLGTLDLVASTDWVAILPGIMMADDGTRAGLVVNPLTQPDLTLDLVMIEPSRRPMSQAADAFLSRMETEGRRLNARWQVSEPGVEVEAAIRGRKAKSEPA